METKKLNHTHENCNCGCDEHKHSAEVCHCGCDEHKHTRHTKLTITMK